MKKSLSILGAMCLVVASISGCANWQNSDTGTVLGGAAGGAVGSQIGSGSGKTIATVVGTLAGAALGNHVGKRFDHSDRRQFGSALESNQTGNTANWTNSDTNDSYSVTPTKTYSKGNQKCRNFTMNTNVDGKSDKGQGTACRQSDGTWKVQ